MFRYNIGQVVPFYVSRADANFDRACDTAHHRACAIFDVDDCGHIYNVDCHRSSSSIQIKFVGYEMGLGMDGHSHIYLFETWVQTNEEEDE